MASGGQPPTPASAMASTTSSSSTATSTSSQVATGSSSSVSPQPPESPWMQFINDAFPDLDTRTYSVPPIHFHRLPFHPEVIGGETVQVLEPPPNKPPPPKQSYGAPKKKVTTPDPEVAGTAFTQNLPGLQESCLLPGDVRDDFAHGHTLECLRTLGERTGQVMVVLSQLEFRKYLDKMTNPIHASAAAALPNVKLKDGECDFILIHRHYGLIVGEVKSIGGSDYFSRAGKRAQCRMIVDKISKAVKQLDNQSSVLTCLVADLGVKVSKILILPNITCAQLELALHTEPSVMQAACQCLGGQDLSSTLARCLCQDSMPDDHVLQLLNDTQFLSTWARLRTLVFRRFRGSKSMRSLWQWWEKMVMGCGRDPAMTPPVYKRLVARFCGPATTIEIPTVSAPPKEIRTHGEAVAEVGLRISRLALYPEQVITERQPSLKLRGRSTLSVKDVRQP